MTAHADNTRHTTLERLGVTQWLTRAGIVVSATTMDYSYLRNTASILFWHYRDKSDGGYITFDQGYIEVWRTSQGSHYKHYREAITETRYQGIIQQAKECLDHWVNTTNSNQNVNGNSSSSRGFIWN